MTSGKHAKPSPMSCNVMTASEYTSPANYSQHITIYSNAPLWRYRCGSCRTWLGAANLAGSRVAQPWRAVQWSVCTHHYHVIKASSCVRTTHLPRVNHMDVSVCESASPCDIRSVVSAPAVSVSTPILLPSRCGSGCMNFGMKTSLPRTRSRPRAFPPCL